MEVYGSGQGRLIAFHGQAQQVLEPALVNGHIERDLFAWLFVRRSHHPTLGHDDGIQQVRRHRMQERVAVGAVHGGAEDCLQIERMSADGDREVGSRGLAFDFNFLQHAAKLAGRRQYAADALEHSQVSFVERVFGRQRRLARIVRAPGAETFPWFRFRREELRW